MLGRMMNKPLLISSLVQHAAIYHHDTDIVSVETTGDVAHTTWAQVSENARQLGAALMRLGLDPQDRCATIAWNNRRHLEIYFGVSGAGFVCHTINPRLFPDQLVYIINHADDKVLFIDATFLPIIIKLSEHLPRLDHVILMGPRDEEAASQFPGLKFYDEFLETGETGFEWPQFDENTASSLCYTSGTTGNPKGVLYSHRSTVLHSFSAISADSLALSARDVVMPVVPMFHVNAWGVPYAAAMAGSSMVLPGPDLSGAALVDLIDDHGVTIALGVPTIWLGLLAHAEKSGSRLTTLERTVVGGSACPPSVITQFREEFGVDTIHAWGMTETSPLGSTNHPLAKYGDLPLGEQHRLRESQGRPPYGVELKIVDEHGYDQPHDGKAVGNLLARGLWVMDSYFRADDDALQDGWFNTGDVATLNEDGYMTVKDRAKDIIKSGGEWISSVMLENIAIGHPGLSDAAVVGVNHDRWDERPILIAIVAEGAAPTPEELLTFFDGKIAAWQVPDKVVFRDELPRTATGKVLKRQLREEYADILKD
ncbi:long-chain fatty acid--CoA ligase [Pontibaca salina]|uniref:3-methylmercaptopropionyl-CoA ligase n=1 Tax=Pontibaca salina TaxID=2795731 RepID=A0A934HSI8_9RHOB|nr:long-chain fatty acid--CoA ligase [Pontibaca salina]MBI6629900.1 long-chain fatty acid--CoA ligase [Pontibaca salina]